MKGEKRKREIEKEREQSREEQRWSFSIWALFSPLIFQGTGLIPSLSCTYPEEQLKHSICTQSIRKWTACISATPEEIQFPWSCGGKGWRLPANTITKALKLIIKDRQRPGDCREVNTMNKKYITTSVWEQSLRYVSPFNPQIQSSIQYSTVLHP